MKAIILFSLCLLVLTSCTKSEPKLIKVTGRILYAKDSTPAANKPYLVYQRYQKGNSFEERTKSFTTDENGNFSTEFNGGYIAIRITWPDANLNDEYFAEKVANKENDICDFGTVYSPK